MVYSQVILRPSQTTFYANYNLSCAYSLASVGRRGLDKEYKGRSGFCLMGVWQLYIYIRWARHFCTASLYNARSKCLNKIAATPRVNPVVMGIFSRRITASGTIHVYNGSTK